jgi:nucleoid DNA-binding protein
MHPFADSMAAQTGLTPEQAGAALRVFLAEIVNTLTRDGRVQLDRFGVFELTTRPAHRGRNPRTGERLSIPAKVRVRFRPSRALEQTLDELSPQGRDS